MAGCPLHPVSLVSLDLAEIVIASNANMGGPTTAAAMAVARRWQTLVIPAILCGTPGYAVATFIGVAVGHWLNRSPGLLSMPVGFRSSDP